MMDDEFEVCVICGNCGACNLINVKKHILVVDYLRKSTEICSNCESRINYKTYSIDRKVYKA